MMTIPVSKARRWKVDHIDLGGGIAAIPSSSKLPPWWSPRHWSGAGDALAALFKVTGVAAVAHTYEKATGKPCGCAERQAALNRALPF